MAEVAQGGRTAPQAADGASSVFSWFNWAATWWLPVLKICALLLALGAVPRVALAQVCGSLDNAFGPFDYRQERHLAMTGDARGWAESLNLVERAHFTPAVEQLIRGATAVLPGPDLDYTLRAFPNHHRALATVLKAWERNRVSRPVGLPKTVECYFDRAVRFRSDDHLVRLLYASYLLKSSRKADAVKQIDFVAQHAGENGFTHFNAGMLYADASMLEQAAIQADKAQELGFARQDLYRRLEQAGHRRAAAPATPAAAASTQDVVR